MVLIVLYIIYDTCFAVCGKTVKNMGNQVKRRKPASWFNQDCKLSKSIFLNAKRTENNKIAFLEARSRFVKTKQKARLSYQNEQKFKLADMSKTSPKTFWKKVNNFRNKKSSATGGITIGEFQEYFNRIMNNRNYDENILDFSNVPDININVEELDMPITYAEVSKAINSLKRGKSPGFDGILNDFFIDGK